MVLGKVVFRFRFSACFKENVLCNWFSTKAAENDVVFTSIRDKGIITLNRPQALNTINLPVVNKMLSMLKEWDTNKKLILIEGAGGKAFCAGGDVRTAAEIGLPGYRTALHLMRKVYTLVGVIENCRTPYIAFIDGIVMGGGVGISVHGLYRVATERTVFAMPETAIGFYPDVGASYILPRLPGKLGYYLALTGTRLRGTDVLKAGIATHFCSSKVLPDLKDALMECTDNQSIKDTLQRFSTDSNVEFSLNPYLERINEYFSASTVEDIISHLQRDSSSWADETLTLLERMSPTSLKVALQEFNRGMDKNILECLQMEYRIGVQCLRNKDFYEGVRALLIDRDQNPSWSPRTLPEVSNEMVEEYFIQRPNEEDLLITR